jgi:hypothetical protein
MTEATNVLNDVKLIVTSIAETIDGVSWVYLAPETWKPINQSINAKFKKEVPMLTFLGGKDANGKGVRTFNIEGVDINVHYDEATGKRVNLMKAADALRFYDASLDTWTDRTVDLDISKFDFSKARAR